MRSCSFHLIAQLADGLKLLTFSSRKDERTECGDVVAWTLLDAPCVPRKPYWLQPIFKSKAARNMRFVAK